MSFEINKQRVKNLLEEVNDEEVKYKVESALECINDPPRHPIVTSAIKLARNRNYGEIALNLAELAYDSYPSSPFFLVELCTNLSRNKKSSEVITKIEAFINENKLDLLPADQKDMIMVTYAKAFKGIGNAKEGIKILENLNSDRENVVESLAQLYYINNEPQKIISLLEGRSKLTNGMSKWQNKAIESINKREVDKNFNQIDAFKDSINKIENREIGDIANSALRALCNLSGESQSKIVTTSIKKIRTADDGIYKDLALDLAKLAYDENQNDPYYLNELCVILNQKGENKPVIDKINEFFNRVERDKLTITTKNKDYLVVTLAHAYSDIDKQTDGIRVLKELGSGAPNVIEALAELYYKANEPNKTVTLLEGRTTLLSEKMAFWLVKSLGSLSRGDEAIKIIDRYDGRYDFKTIRLELLEGNQQPITPLRSNLQGRNKVFISHKESDQEMAEDLVELILEFLDLNNENIICTSVPGHTLKYGKPIIQSIKDEIHDSPVMIALITPDSLKSTWVLFELGASWALNKFVIPILAPTLTEKDLPGPISELHCVMVDSPKASSDLLKALSDISSHMDVPQKNSLKIIHKLETFLNAFRSWELSDKDHALMPSVKTDHEGPFFLAENAGDITIKTQYSEYPVKLRRRTPQQSCGACLAPPPCQSNSSKFICLYPSFSSGDPCCSM
jgi:hypothetical protein